MSTTVSFTTHEVFQGLLQEKPAIVADFYRHIYPKAVIMICRCFPGDPKEWLEDCFSTAFLKFLARIKAADFEPRNLDAYALEVIKRTYLNTRKKHKSLVLFTDQLPDLPQPVAEPPVQNAADLFIRFQQKKLSRWYRQLPPRQRKMLDLRAQGWEYQEIATAVGVSYGVLRNHFSKLLREARKLA